MSFKCKQCSHEKVCLHKQAYESLADKAWGILPGEEVAVMGSKYPFKVDVNCIHYCYDPQKDLYSRLC